MKSHVVIIHGSYRRGAQLSPDFMMPTTSTTLVRASSAHLKSELPYLFLEARESCVVTLPLQRCLADGTRRHAALDKRVAVIDRGAQYASRAAQPAFNTCEATNGFIWRRSSAQPV